MKKRRKKRKRRLGGRIVLLLISAIVFTLCIIVGVRLLKEISSEKKLEVFEGIEAPSWVDVQLIDIDGAARRGEHLDGIKNIVIHYVGYPGTTAKQNRNYFNNPGVDVSSHFVVGLQGEIIQCLPLKEKSSASNWRNNDTISIEVCHPDSTGRFNETTYKSLVKLTAWLTDLCDFDEDSIIRHYDINEKLCPLYYVENEDAWLQFKKDVMKATGNI